MFVTIDNFSIRELLRVEGRGGGDRVQGGEVVDGHEHVAGGATEDSASSGRIANHHLRQPGAAHAEDLEEGVLRPHARTTRPP